MRKGFTLIELMTVIAIIAIIAIIAAVAIPNIMEHKALQDSAKIVIGRTFILNGTQAVVTSYSMGKYKVVLMGSPPPIVEMDKPVVDAIYAEYVRTHVEKP